MSIFSIINKSASGMTAERMRMDIIAENIANVDTTVTDKGGPYRRKMVVFEERRRTEFRIPMNVRDEITGKNAIGEGVRVKKIIEDESPLKYEYNPAHPNADENGYVAKTNVNIIEEMTDMITATRAYEANVTVISNAKGMAQAALNIGK